MMPLESSHRQESHVLSISKPSLMMLFVLRLQDANMTTQYQATNNVINDVIWKTLIHICLLSGSICDCLV
jgi:hypothetical protein